MIDLDTQPGGVVTVVDRPDARTVSFGVLTGADVQKYRLVLRCERDGEITAKILKQGA